MNKFNTNTDFCPHQTEVKALTEHYKDKFNNNTDFCTHQT